MVNPAQVFWERLPALNRKALRDLWRNRSMMLVISLMIMSGAGLFITLVSTLDSLKTTQEAYYADYRFADVFAGLKRAPESASRDLLEVPGVGAVQTRIAGGASVEIEGFDSAVRGLFLSIPDGGQPRLNRIHLREGRLPRAYDTQEVVVADAFASAHGLRPGDRLTAVMDGRRTPLVVSGIGLSPEYIYQGDPGSIIPDFTRFGIFWMGRSAMESAFDMRGAFNDVSLALMHEADPEEVIAGVDAVLESFGGAGAKGRIDQPSHFFITEEFRQLESMSTLIPTIFLGVAGFLISVVVGRMVKTQRGQIAILKAFGYSDWKIGGHYGILVSVIVLVGLAGGVGFGVWLGRNLAELYAQYYRFPFIDYRLDAQVFLLTAAVSVAAASIGVVRSVGRAVSLPPAEAMRPEAPARYSKGWMERTLPAGWLDPASRMVVRHLGRHRLKTAMSVIGIGFGLALVMLGRMSQDSVDLAMEVEFRRSQLYDLSVGFSRPLSERALYDAENMEGVERAEPFRIVPVRFRRGHLQELSTLEGLPEGMALRKIMDADGKPVSIPRDGVLLTRMLGDLLQVAPGDTLRVELLEGSRRTLELPVAGFMDQFFGLGGYMSLEAMRRWLPEPAAVSGVYLQIRDGETERVERSLRVTPVTAAVVSTREIVDLFYESTAQTWLIMAVFVSLFAGATAFSVVYNHARISLSERSREMASLRILGLNRAEVARILLGELWVLVLLAVPVGFLLGWALTGFIILSLQTELYRIPMAISRQTLSIAALTVLATAVVSSWVVRRRVYRLDLISVLKSRE